jgi:hypothetical protein
MKQVNISEMAATLLHDKQMRSVTKYVSPKEIVRLTKRRFRNGKIDITYLLTIGKPNYVEREHIQSLLKAKEPFPVKKLRLKFYPKKKKA